MLGLIKRTCKGLDDPKTLRTLYFSLVCSNLESLDEKTDLLMFAKGANMW